MTIIKFACHLFTCSYNMVTDDKRQATTETRILFVLSKFQGYRVDLILAQETNERSPILGAESVYDLHKPFKMNWNQTNNKRMRNANYQFQVSKWERLTLHKSTHAHTIHTFVIFCFEWDKGGPTFWYIGVHPFCVDACVNFSIF